MSAELNPGAEVPKLRFDVLLAQLIEQAQDVLATQGRLRALVGASRMINGDLSLPAVLRRIVEAACQLVSARYGALGVVAPSGGWASFVYVGVDEDAAERIGAFPTGKGLLGALIDDPRPIRLTRMEDDPRSTGYPPNHPSMSSFLGVPIHVRGEVFGNLYLTESATGQFSVDDEELVTALAATAGIAIENARLFEQGERRQRWLQSSARITRQLLSFDGEEPLALVAQEVRHMADADVVSVVLPSSDGDRLMVEVTAGAKADQLVGMTYARAGSLAGQALEGNVVNLADASTEQRFWLHLSEVIALGPVMALPLVGSLRTLGALVVGRRADRPVFEAADVEMAATFANHAALALELADARVDQQKVILLEERDRIARDLHDHVIQRLFAVGLTVEGITTASQDSSESVRLGRVVDELDGTIRQIRSSIFALRGELGPQTGSVRSAILEVIHDVGPTLPAEPHVVLIGPIDSVVPEEAVDDVTAVLREALTNVARHARGSSTEVTVTVNPSSLMLEITDDGIGIGATSRRSGLDNIRHRAERRGGRLDVGPPFATSPKSWGGTRLLWTIPLP